MCSSGRCSTRRFEWETKLVESLCLVAVLCYCSGTIVSSGGDCCGDGGSASWASFAAGVDAAAASGFESGASEAAEDWTCEWRMDRYRLLGLEA